MSTRLLTEYPSLASLSDSDLKDLLTDEQLLRAVLDETPPVKLVIEQQEGLIRSNDELARRNLALQTELVALRSSTTSAYAAAQHLKDRWTEIERKQAVLYQKHRPSFLHMRLTHSTTEQDLSSERLAQQFIEGSRTPPSSTSAFNVGFHQSEGGGASGPGSRTDSPAFGEGPRAGNGNGNGSGTPTGGGHPDPISSSPSVEEFIRTFRASRKIYHKRALWGERWAKGEVAWRED